MRGTFAVSKYVAKAMLIRRWTARIVWGMQRQAAAQILATWRANVFIRSRSAAAGGSPADDGAAGPPILLLVLICFLVRVLYGSRDLAGRIGLDFSMAVVAVPFILYLLVVRFCSSKPCNTVRYEYKPRDGTAAQAHQGQPRSPVLYGIY